MNQFITLGRIDRSTSLTRALCPAPSTASPEVATLCARMHARAASEGKADARVLGRLMNQFITHRETKALHSPRR